MKVCELQDETQNIKVKKDQNQKVAKLWDERNIFPLYIGYVKTHVVNRIKIGWCSREPSSHKCYSDKNLYEPGN